MNGKKFLALAALTSVLVLGTSACGGQDNGAVAGAGTSAPSKPGPSSEPASTSPGDTPTDFADADAQAALADRCGRMPLDGVASLLGVPEVKMRNDVREGDGVTTTTSAYCAFMEPSADEYGQTDWNSGQTYLSISVAGAATPACNGCSGGNETFADGSTGYYGGPDGTSLRVTPAGSAYEFSFSVALPYERSTASGLDQKTTDLWRKKTAEAAHLALD